MATPVLIESHRSLDSNPFAALWVAAAERAGYQVVGLRVKSALLARRRRGVLHIQWPDDIISGANGQIDYRRVGSFIGTLLLARAFRMPILFTVHNNAGHESTGSRKEALAWTITELFCTDLHIMARSGLLEIVEAHPRLASKTIHVVPHGHYREVLPASKQTDDSQNFREATAPLVLAFGRLRAYKGFERLCEIAAQSRSRSWALTIAGSPDSPKVVSELQATALGTDIRLVLHSIPETELQHLIISSQLIVLPYRKILNSGSVLLALSLNRPVLVPATPSMIELRGLVGDRWVHLFRDELTGKDVSEALTDLPRSGETAPLDWCDWNLVEDLLKRLV